MMTACLAQCGDTELTVMIAGPAWPGKPILYERNGKVIVDGYVTHVLNECRDVDLGYLCKKERRLLVDLARAES